MHKIFTTFQRRVANFNLIFLSHFSINFEHFPACSIYAKFSTTHNKEKKAFSISELLACCCAAPDPSQEYKLFRCVGCEVWSVHLYRADRQDSTELMTQNWLPQHSLSVINLKPFRPCCDLCITHRLFIQHFQ